jgi:hypothetical protein
MLYRNTALSTIHPIGKSPLNTPYRADNTAKLIGMVKVTVAMSKATTKVSSVATNPDTLRLRSNTNKRIIGIVATSAEIIILCKGLLS